LPIIAQYLLARELNPNWGDLINPLINWEWMALAKGIALTLEDIVGNQN
jgi:hypothetical protein